LIFDTIYLPRLSTSDRCLSRFFCIGSFSRSIFALSAGIPISLTVVSETAFVFNVVKGLVSVKTFVVASATALRIAFLLSSS